MKHLLSVILKFRQAMMGIGQQQWTGSIWEGLILVLVHLGLPTAVTGGLFLLFMVIQIPSTSEAHRTPELPLRAAKPEQAALQTIQLPNPANLSVPL